MTFIKRLKDSLCTEDRTRELTLDRGGHLRLLFMEERGIQAASRQKTVRQTGLHTLACRF
jgi:hypothetical protein